MTDRRDVRIRAIRSFRDGARTATRAKQKSPKIDLERHVACKRCFVKYRSHLRECFPSHAFRCPDWFKKGTFADSWTLKLKMTRKSLHVILRIVGRMVNLSIYLYIFIINLFIWFIYIHTFRCIIAVNLNFIQKSTITTILWSPNFSKAYTLHQTHATIYCWFTKKLFFVWTRRVS